MIETELQAHQIDKKLTPKVNHSAPGIFHVAGSGLLENAFVNVVRDLVAQIFLPMSAWICSSSSGSISAGSTLFRRKNSR